MGLPDRRIVGAFLFRLALLFSMSLMPVPWLADAYTSCFDAGANALLPLFDGAVVMRFAPPETIRVNGSWKGALHVTDSASGQSVNANLDVRSYSYRPIATFLALALASPLVGWRRNAKVLGGGLGAMLALTTLFSSLPILARFGAGGVLGAMVGLAVETAYQALATPVMVYAMPLVVWLLAMRATRLGPPAAPAPATTA